jgi:amino acid adenylation domain-containing protein
MKANNIEDIYPLSPMQQGILFHTLYASEPGTYVIQIGWTLRGALDTAAFRKAWQDVVERHAALRTAFAWERLAEPVQIVWKRLKLAVEEQDLRGLEAADQAARARRFAEDDWQKGFDPTRAPLVRVALLRLADDAWRLVWTVHHLLLDGWSTQIVVRDLFALYQAHAQGTPPRLERARPYAEYIGWLLKQDRARVEAFWRQELAGFRAPTPLGVDRSEAPDEGGTDAPSTRRGAGMDGPPTRRGAGMEGPPSRRGYVVDTPAGRFAERRRVLPEAATAAVSAFARQHQITPSTLVQGAWALLLSRYAGEQDVLFGATVSGRSAPVPGIESMVGLFINTLPVRARVEAEAPAVAWLAALQRHEAELRDYEHSPLVDVQGWSEVPRGTPLFESLVVIENYPVSSLGQSAAAPGAASPAARGAVAVTEPQGREVPPYPLTLTVVIQRTLLLGVGYAARRFEAAAVDRILGHLVTLLEGIVAAPRRPLGDLPMLTAEEIQAFDGWNRAALAARPASPALLHELVEAQVDRTPDAIAVTARGGSLTYRELDRRANRVARRLARLGVGPDDLVAVCMERSLDLPVALLGVLKAGGAYLPIDPSYPADRIAYMIADARAPVILSRAGLAPDLPAGRATILAVDADPEIDREGEGRIPCAARPEHLAYVIYTSGSTGRPKGAMIPHRAIVSHMVWMRAEHPLDASSAVLQKTPAGFDASVWEFFLPLMCGARLVMARPGSQRDTAYLVDAMVEERVTELQVVPTLLEMLLLEPDLERCASLRHLFVGGEPLTRALVDRFRARLPIDVVNLYGPTECAVQTVVSVARRAEVASRSQGGVEGRMEPIGRPIDGVSAYVLDRSLLRVPVGVVGELHLGGRSVGRGYLGRPDLTAERFLPDPWSARPGERLYRTGDLARWLPSGVLECLGRVDHQVKLRGFRVELGEIEALLRQHPDVREAVAVVREDTPGDRRLVAYLVPHGDPPDATELRQFVKDQLPDFMAPTAYVCLDALPVGTSGKVDRKALPPPEAGALGDPASVPSRGPVELAVAALFTELLRLPPGAVGAHDDFFALGGHSLVATQLLTRIRAALGADLPLRAVFEAPTPAELAVRIRAAAGAGHDDPPRIERVPRGGELPLSFGQERMWFLAQLDPASPAYVIPLALRLSGKLDVEALEGAISALAARHEVLRTTFRAGRDGPVAIIHDPAPVPLPRLSLASLPPGDRERAARAEVDAEARRPFDLAAGPLLRARVLDLAEDDHVLLLTLHHIVTDAWTSSILNREIGQLYDARRRGDGGRDAPTPVSGLVLGLGPPSSRLVEQPLQYADYAAWQRRWLSGPVLDGQIAYWKKQLEGAPAALDLPADRPRPPVPSFRGGARNFLLSADLSGKLKELARREGVTLYMALLAAFDVLLCRHSGQDDILVGTPVAGRGLPETERMVGFFLNTLVMRVKVAPSASFKQLLAHVKEVALGAYAHQDMPFERLVRAIGPEPDPSRSPIFQVIFNLQNAPREAIGMRGLELSPMPVENATVKVDLTLMMGEGPSSLEGRIEYAADLFDAATVDRMARRFETILGAVVEDPQRRVAEIPILPPEERRRLIVEWNDTQTADEGGASFQDLFEAQVDRTPGAPALAARGAVMSHLALDERANRLAHHLRRLGVGPDAVVGLHLDRGADLVVGLLGILKAGGAYLPLDPGQPPRRLAQMVREAGARVIVTQASLAGALDVAGVHAVRLDADADAIAAESPARPPIETTPSNLAYVIFTSGSTGTPKGVAVEHRQLVSYVRGVSRRLALPEGARYAHVSTFAADLGHTVLFPSLASGGCLHVIPEDLATDPDALGAYFQREGIDCLKIVPSHLAALLSGAQPDRVLPRRLLVLGGEASTWDLVRRVERLAPDCRILNHYGPTETTVGVLTFAVERGRDVPGAPIVPLGRPLPDSRVYVLDTAMQPAPIGVPGEIYVGGAGVARGYLNRPDLTKERFVRDPWNMLPGARLYRTGDRARHLADGTLVFLGRLDQQVKIRGHRVEIGEIEAALAACPGVKEAAVLAIEEGAGDRSLCAYLAPAGLRLAEVRAALAERLPDPMIPAAFVLLDALPLTPNGKVDRRALAEVPRQAPGDAPLTPRNPVEEVLAAIWADVFQRDRVGVHDRFHDLGGHSLLAIQIVARAREAFQVDVPLRAVFEAPTVAGLAEHVEALRAEGRRRRAPPVTRAPRDGDLPLSFAQERLWFLDRLEPGQPSYNVVTGTRLLGPLDAAAMGRAIAEIVRRHEALRTTFALKDGAPVQIVHEDGGVRLDVRDLSGVPEEIERDFSAREMAAAEALRPFDLERGPIFRATLIRLAAEDHLLILALHHIASDARTQAILAEEIAQLHDAFRRGLPSPLPDPPLQYADYAVWQRRVFTGALLDEQLAYWRAALAGAPAAIDLPSDRPRPKQMSHRGGRHRFAVPPAVRDALAALSRREGATLFMTLLAALDVLLHRYTGQDDLVVGTPMTERTQPETQGTVGLFLNTLALRARLDPDQPFHALVARVRETCLGAYAHQDLPFERLVHELSPVRDASRTPIFQVLYTLETAPREEGGLPGVRRRPMPPALETARFDLSLFLMEGPRGIAATLEYATDLFDASTAERMGAQLAVLLEGLAQGSDRPIGDLPILPEAERALLVHTWNATDAPCPDATVVALFEAQAARTPLATAVSCGDRALDYRSLAAGARRLARHLRRRGVTPGAKVGLCVDRSVDMVVALLGVLAAGAAYVPLDPGYPRARLAFVAADAALDALVTEEAPASLVPAGDVPVVRLDADRAAIDAEDDAPLDLAADPGALAYLIYTSGSTGAPKGVEIPHRALASFLAAMRVRPGLDAGDCLVAVTSLSFDIAALEIFLPLTVGARVAIARRDEAMDGAALRRLVERVGATALQGTPSTWRLLLDAGADLRALKALVGGEAVPQDLADALAAQAASAWNLYGPTETTVWSTVHRLAKGERVLIGQPIANTRVHVLDRGLAPASIGVPGELYIGGEGLARGYHGRPDLTAERFVPDPFAGPPGGRLYRTGDLVRRRPGGALEFLGRLDHQVKIRGYRIELGEIESVLARYPSVEGAVVIAREDAPGDVRLVAYVAAPASIRADALRAAVQAELPDYMVPSAYVVLDALPLTPAGKVDRRALPASDPARARETHGALRGPVEEAIAGFFREVLRVDEVGAHDAFFDLGGHSLLATQVMARVRSALGVEVPLRALFEAPTPAGLARRVEEALGAGATTTAPPLVRVAREGTVPLSSGQERLWFLDQLTPGDASYVVPVLVRFAGRADRDAIGRAVRELVRRHEVLRTVYALVDGAPVGIVRDELDAAPAFTSVIALPEAERAAALRRAVTEEARRPFDLAAGPVLRAHVLEVSGEEHAVLLTMHHIVSDAWTARILREELSALYGAFRAGAPSPLADPPIQYADWAAWQRRRLEGGALDAQLAYWTQHLAGAPAAMDLPSDRPRPQVPSGRGARRSFALPEDLGRALAKLGQREGATLFMTLLAALDVLLFRYTGQRDLVVGTPIANRTHAETERVVGFFVNTLALRAEIDEGEGFASLLGRVREACLGAYAHQDMPFERLVQHLAPERDLSRTPLFQVMLVLENTPREAVAAPELAGGPEIDADHGTAKFDLTLWMAEGPRGLAGSIEYATDLFDAPTIARMAGHLRVLLEGVVARPLAPLSEIAILRPEEEHQLVVAWNATDAPFPAGATLHDLFEAQAAAAPEAAALVMAGRATSYRDLDVARRRLADRLVARGVGRGARVGVCMDRSPEMVAAVLAVLAAGGAFVPLDPAYPRERLSLMIEDARLAALVTQARIAPGLPASGVEIVCVDRDDPLQQHERRAPGARPPAPADVAYVIYTSGSTGRPKGVCGTHAGAVNRMAWMWRVFPFEPGEVCCQKTTLSFVDSIWEIFGPLLRGTTTVLLPDDVVKDVPRLVGALAEAGVTRLVLVPSLLRAMLDTHADLAARLPALRWWTTSGEALPADLAARFAAELPGRVLVNLYGSSEVAADATCFVPTGEPWAHRVPIGRPIDNTRTYVLDPRMSPAPIGVPGELYVGGAGLADGYLGRPDLTAERFVPDPFSPAGARLFKTGDIARFLPSGVIEYLGRADHQVKIRGFRVEIDEVEIALAAHPAVRQAVVAAREHEGGDLRLVAYVVAHEGRAAPAAAELRAYLRDRLPDFMIPSAFAVLGALPLTPSGKVNRRALPAPELSGEAAPARVPPRDDVEALLLGVWRRVLGIESVGVTDGFFDLGGHSLLAVRMLAEVKKVLGRTVPLVALFQAQTIADLAPLLREDGPRRTWSTLVPIKPSGSKTPLFLVSRPNVNSLGYLALARHLDPDQPVYGLQYQYPEESTLGRPYTREEYGQWAARYVEILRSVQPKGPYLLGGMCEGALIAFQMARQLEAAGEEVALLSMMDAWPEENTRSRPLTWIFTRERRLRAILARSWPERLAFAASYARRAVGLAASRPQRPANGSPGEPWEERVFPGPAFVPPTITSPITVFRVKTQPYWRIRDEYLGWRSRTTGGVELHWVQGDHVTFLREPHVESLGKQLAGVLRRVEERLARRGARAPR